MLAVVGGLGAALAFTGATLCNSRTSRMIGPWSLLAWVMLIGLAVVGLPAAIGGVPDGLDGPALRWLALAAVGSVAGLLLVYTALRSGQVGIVAPIVSTQGAIAALISVAAGERIATVAALMLALVAVGVVLAGSSGSGGSAPAGRGPVLLSVAGAFAFGASLYATGRVGEELPVPWALLPSRLLGTLAIAVPLAAAARLRMTRRALPLVLASGVFEVAGFALFVLGARHGLAVSAVLSSQFAALSAVAAYVLFRERLAPVQLAGVAAIVVGVATLSAVQA
jgi:drug/metabolite transporter (DMT)-like permease